MDYAVHNVPSYQHMQDSASPSHLGSKSPTSHTGNNSTPGESLGGSGAKEQNPGGSTPGKVGSGKPTRAEKGAPGGMDM